MDQRTTITADKLEAMLEAELRKQGCDAAVTVEPDGHEGDWKASVDNKMTTECKHAYIVLLSRLKRDFFLDYVD